jgi:hypothetical protein
VVKRVATSAADRACQETVSVVLSVTDISGSSRCALDLTVS